MFLGVSGEALLTIIGKIASSQQPRRSFVNSRWSPMSFLMAEGSRLWMVLGLDFLYKLGFSDKARYLGCLRCLRNRETWVYMYNMGDNDACYNYHNIQPNNDAQKKRHIFKTSLCKTLLGLFIISSPTMTLKKNAIFLKRHCVKRQY